MFKLFRNVADCMFGIEKPHSINAKVYSGYLKVPGPFKGFDYDSLSIHYQFEEAQSDAAKAPVVTWHQVGASWNYLLRRLIN